MQRKLPLAVLAVAAALAVPSASLAAAAARSGAQAAPAATVELAIRSDTQHGRRGPDGAWHDAYLPAAFSAKAGRKVTVTVTNYDPSAHTFTSPGLGLNVVLPAARGARPSITTFSFRPTRAGAYDWYCAAGCDPWAMGHLGYMRGRITVGA